MLHLHKKQQFHFKIMYLLFFGFYKLCVVLLCVAFVLSCKYNFPRVNKVN